MSPVQSVTHVSGLYPNKDPSPTLPRFAGEGATSLLLGR
jgi:hypothetical protein